MISKISTAAKITKCICRGQIELQGYGMLRCRRRAMIKWYLPRWMATTYTARCGCSRRWATGKIVCVGGECRPHMGDDLYFALQEIRNELREGA